MIYVQTHSGLTPISSQLTKEKIVAALGYTPADNTSFYEDESGALIIADERGYVVARIDEQGLKTTKVDAKAVILNGEDLAKKLQELANKVPEIDLTGYALDSDVKANKASADAHAADSGVHVTQSDKYAWDAKSNFSGNYADLANAPNITVDDENELVISDTKGNAIMRVNSYGINTTALYIKGRAMTEGIGTFYVRWDTDEQPTPYEFKYGMNFKDWVNSSYCKLNIDYGTADYYRLQSAGLCILEDYNDMATKAVYTTTLYNGKTFYGRADGYVEK